MSLIFARTIPSFGERYPLSPPRSLPLAMRSLKSVDIVEFDKIVEMSVQDAIEMVETTSVSRTARKLVKMTARLP